MTNPGNIVRVRSRNGGRASVYEANAWAQGFTTGVLDGVGVTQSTPADMNVLVGGSNTKPDVVLAINPAGYRIALDLIGQQAITITAPASNSRISSIVAYTDDLSLSTTQDTVTGSPASCGLIVVNGTPSSTPSAPTDAQIRTEITADGATGSQAAYCVIAEILVANDTTTIDNSLITNKIASIGNNLVGTDAIKNSAVTENKIGWSTFTEKVLYNDNTGTTGTINLSESAANFEYIRIFAINNDGDCFSTDVYKPDNKRVNLTSIHGASSTTAYGKCVSKKISGTTITTVANSYNELVFDNGTAISVSGVNNIKIYRVVGFNRIISN